MVALHRTSKEKRRSKHWSNWRTGILSALAHDPIHDNRMLRAGRLLRNGFSGIMASGPVHTLLSEAEIRSMNHEQLLEYAIRSATSSTTNTACGKRDEPSGGLQNFGEPSTQTISISMGEKAPTDSNVVIRQVLQMEERKAEQKKKSKKRRKEFDMSRYGQRMIALKLNYQGWNFHGFASQTTTDDSVEAHLFNALLRTCLIESKETCDYSRAGRTDVGVSALAQVVGLRVRSAIVPPSSDNKELDYVKTINSALPDGMRVIAWSPACDGTCPTPRLYGQDNKRLLDYWESVHTATCIVTNKNDDSNDYGTARRPGEKFSARFDATWRSYKYFFARSTFNLKAMSEAAKMFEGRHDFRNFCRFDESVTNFERVLFNVEIREAVREAVGVENSERKVCENECVDDMYKMYYIFVRGQAFLWHQVRCMAAVLFDVGRGLEEPNVVFHMLNDVKQDKGTFAHGRPHYRLASPTPLLLFECSYPKNVIWFGEKDEITEKSLEKADNHIAGCWTREASKCAVVREILEDTDKMFGEVGRGKKRQLVVDGIGGDLHKHIAYRLRGRDDPVSLKILRAEKKRSERGRAALT